MKILNVFPPWWFENRVYDFLTMAHIIGLIGAPCLGDTGDPKIPIGAFGTVRPGILGVGGGSDQPHDLPGLLSLVWDVG